MTVPEKLGIAVVLVLAAAAVYFIYDFVSDGRDRKPVLQETREPARGVKEETPGEIVTEIQGKETSAAAGEEVSARERITPSEAAREAVGALLGILQGRVKDEAGEPVEGAVISLRKGGTSLLPHLPAQRKLDVETRTGPDGRYVLESVEAGGPYTIVVDHPDYAQATLGPVRLKAGVRKELPDLILGHGTTVSGMVTDGFKNPIVGARVRILDPIGLAFLPEEERKPYKQMLTDNSGSFRFENVSFKTFEVVVSADGFATQRKRNNVQFEAKKEVHMDFMLQEGTFLAGLVTDSQGVPLSEVKVEATLVQNKKYSSSGTALTGTDGAFNIEGLAEGKYVVRASKPEYSDDVKQNIPAGRSNVRLVLQPRGGVAGFVRDEKTDKPLKKFSIRVMLSRKGRPPRQTRIVHKFDSVDGSFTITDLDPGDYTFLVSAKGYAEGSSDEVTVVRDYVVDNVVVYMNRGGSLSGRVVDRTGVPVKGVKVALNENNFQDSPFFQIFSALAGPGGAGPEKKKAFTGGDGTFKIDLIVPGKYQAAFSHDTFSPKAINDVEVFLDQRTDMGTVVLTQGASVHGTVYDASGRPVPGSMVIINQPNAFMKQVASDKKGGFSFRHLNPGEYTLTVQLTRLGGRSIDNIFKRLIISEKSKIKVYLEEGKDLTADIHLIE